MSRITEYIFDDDLEQILKEYGAMSGVTFAVKMDDDSFVGPKPPDDAQNAVETPIEIEGEEDAKLIGHSPEMAREKVEESVNMLKTVLEGRVANEMELESLSMEIANNYEELNQVLQNNNLFADALDIDQISKITLGRALEVTKSTIASMMLYDKEKETLKLHGRLGGREGAGDAEEIPVKGSIWENVVLELQPLLVEDVNNPEELDPEVYKKVDLASYAAKTFLSVPLKVKEESIGVLNVGDKEEGNFLAPDMKFLAALASQSASSIEKARLYSNIEKEAKLRSNFARYLSPSIVEDIMNNNTDLSLGGELIECSILFSDICGFTSMTENEKPETIVHLLNEYFSIMTEIIFRNKGTLDKFVGDAIMAIFGAPIFSPTSHQNAVIASLEMHQGLQRLTRKWKAEGLPTFRQRVGINTGMVIAGNIGSPDRMDYTVIGDVVNLASRMESNATPMTTLISHYTYEKVKDVVKVKKLDPIHVKGKQEEIHPYEIQAIKPIVTDADSVRRFTRFEVAISPTIKDVADVSRSLDGTVLNISLGGCLMAMPVEIDPKIRLTLNLPLGENGEDLNFSGKIVFRKKLKDAIGTVYYYVGLEFDESGKKYEKELRKFIET